MKVKVLITCGATWTPIDDVRVISNISTGEMGHSIAQAFKRAGANVTVIEGPVTHTLLAQGIKIIKYRFFDQLAKLLKIELRKKYAIIIHAAAVSDFKLPGVRKGKITSGRPLTLRLKATPKLIETIKVLSPESFLVGFKLETRLSPKNIFKIARPLFNQSGCDVVVANTLTGGYRGYIVNADGEILAKAADKEKLAKALVKLVS